VSAHRGDGDGAPGGAATACERAQELVVERLQAPLAAADERWLADHLDACAACRAEAEVLASTWGELEAIAAPEPSPLLRARFRRALAAEAARPTAALGAGPWWRQLAAAVVLLGAGVALGATLVHQRSSGDLATLQGEVRNLNTTVALTLLRQDAASERLLGTQFGGRAADDAQVVGALLDAVAADPSVNVRLAALDALARIAGHRDVQERLLAGLPEQPSPMAQVAIADLLLEHGGPAMRQRLAGLAAGEQLDTTVRDHLRRALGRAT
jgi:hypothetical protein